MAISVSSEPRIDLLGTAELLHDHLTTSLCQTVFQQTRSTERERQWSLAALASFWTEVIVRAPQSLTRALQEAAVGSGSGWPHVPASPEAFFQRCQNLDRRFFANLHATFLTRVLPQAQPVYAAPVHDLRQRFAEVWIVDGSRLDAVARRLKLLWDVRAQVLPGCLTAFYDLYRGIVRHLAFDADAAAGELPRATAQGGDGANQSGLGRMGELLQVGELQSRLQRSARLCRDESADPAEPEETATQAWHRLAAME